MIETARLMIVPADARLLAAELTGEAELALALGAELETGWPPEGNDDDVAAWFYSMVAADPKQAGWWSWYIIEKGDEPLVVGGCGFKGPPADGVVEIGYAVVEPRQCEGLATEAVRALIDHARNAGPARRVEAETLAGNEASIAVLVKLGFDEIVNDQSPLRRFALDL